MHTEARTARALELRRAGKMFWEIGEALGVSSTVAARIIRRLPKDQQPVLDIEWDEGRERQLRALLGRGLSAGEIAKSLGRTTRNAVIGKVHRLGLRLVGTQAERHVRSRAGQKQIRRVWTPEMVTTLKDLAEAGHSRPQISEVMALPIYTVSKKLLALDIRTRGNDLDVRQARGRTINPPGTGAGIPRPLRIAPRPPKPQEGPGPASCTLEHISPRQCRAVVQDAPRYCMDEALMCGAPTDGRAYCAGHWNEFYGGIPERKPTGLQAYEHNNRRAA